MSCLVLLHALIIIDLTPMRSAGRQALQRSLIVEVTGVCRQVMGGALHSRGEMMCFKSTQETQARNVREWSAGNHIELCQPSASGVAGHIASLTARGHPSSTEGLGLRPDLPTR